MARTMAYEEEVKSLDDLSRELSILDPDAGIRVEGSYKGKECFVFVTRRGSGFALALYEATKKDKLSIPGRKLEFIIFGNEEGVKEFIFQNIKGPLRIFKY